MNRDLAKTVLAAFRDDGACTAIAKLSSFSLGDWRRTSHWLDASGLALYLLARLEALSADQQLPPSVRASLEQKRADNRGRTQDLLSECLRINQAFQTAGISYLNLKGITLTPDYCPDLSLRTQFDLDFGAPLSSAKQCKHELEKLGYVVSGHSERTLELKTNEERLPSLRDFYKARKQRSVEVHFIPDDGQQALGRTRTIQLDGRCLPALSEPDAFLGQTQHLFRHATSEWTRLSWLMELRNFVISRVADIQLWQEVRRLAESPEAGLAIGVSLSLAEKAFGLFAPSELSDWTVARVPARVQLWVNHYWESALLRDFPGTKLYVILQRAILGNERFRNEGHNRRIVPLHRPPRITVGNGRRLRDRFATAQTQAKYFVFRLRFHLLEGGRYVVESYRWNRMVRGELAAGKLQNL
jgi:hypothetical protein